MAQVYTIGRAGNQPFRIDESHLYVHGEHARMTLDPQSRQWLIEDLKDRTGNGVYVRDPQGRYRRVLSARIKPTDVVRLGPESANSFTFMAAHILSPADYRYEFSYARALDAHLKAEEQARTAVNKRHNVVNIAVPVVMAALCGLLRLSGLIDAMTAIVAGSFLTAAAGGLFRYLYRNDADALREIKSRRDLLVQCPKCWRTLSDYDLRHGRCSACKAM